MALNCGFYSNYPDCGLHHHYLPTTKYSLLKGELTTLGYSHFSFWCSLLCAFSLHFVNHIKATNYLSKNHMSTIQPAQHQQASTLEYQNLQTGVNCELVPTHQLSLK